MQMRLRLPELLAEHKPPLTAYGVAKRSSGRISLSTIYRLCRDEGKVANFDGELMEALCDVFGVRPGELLEREAEGTSAKRRARRRKRPASAEK